MVMRTKGSGNKIKPMEKVSSNVITVPSTMATGRTINKLAKEKNSGQMDLLTRAITRKV
jgi:hypothetical protein